MDTATFAAFRRASQQLCADNQATLDWADDAEFHYHVNLDELKAAIELLRNSRIALRSHNRAPRTNHRRK